MLKANFKPAQTKKFFIQFRQKVHAAIIDRLNYIGEQAVTDAKLLSTFKDDTGNLRNSMCYITLHDGRQVSPGRIPRQSQKVIDNLKYEFGEGFVLIICAGMHYAAAVEAKNYDVISNASGIALGKLLFMVKDLKNNISK